MSANRSCYDKSMKGEHWYRHAVLYHIYPLSFADSNGDGFGDLPGVISRLDYLQELGASAVWLSPVYLSPMADWGYDVADHMAVDPRLGTMTDMEELIAQLHRRGMKLLLDFVPGHTSIRHPWFEEARASRHNPKRDWYIWADPGHGGAPPNNWISEFGGSSWTLDPGTGQYYLHTFLPEQPDLNWRNPEVRRAMLGVLRFWLAKGVDGFRTDAVMTAVKDRLLRDDPPNPDFRPGLENPARAHLRLYSGGQKELLGLVNRFCDVLAGAGDDLLLSEAYLDVPGLSQLYRACAEHPLHAPFNFNLISLDWGADAIGRFIEQYESALRPQDLPNWVLGNHDRPRVAARLGEPKARLMAFLQLTLRGLPVIYYGDELGMTDARVPAAAARDPLAWRLPGLRESRDPERAPMAWDGTRHGGFTTGEPWLPPAPGLRHHNVAAEQADPGSAWQLYRRLIDLRRRYPQLATGAFTRLETESADVLVYRRGEGKGSLVAALNFADSPQTAPVLPDHDRLASTHSGAHPDLLAPFEGRLYARRLG